MTLSDDALSALEDARARVHAQVAQARERAEDAGRMAGDVRTATATAVSPGREVRVTAAAGGRVDRVEIAEVALSRDARNLSRLVTETVRAAQRDAADAALRRMTQSLGETSPLIAAARQRLDDEYAHSTQGRRSE